MILILPLLAAALAAYAPLSQETAMHREPDSGNAPNGARATASGSEASGIGSNPTRGGAGRQGPAGLGSGPEPLSVVETAAPALSADSPAEARGRRILSTAFVMMGPDGRLSVKLHNGRSLVIRNVVMRRKKYCGVQVLGGQVGVRYCGGYADVAAARPGPAPAHDEPDLAIPNPLKGDPPQKD
jgi:hypothetical protein